MDLASRDEVLRLGTFDVIVNATGAWVDHTLRSLGMTENRLMGGTKGSHFITGHPRLQELLGGLSKFGEIHVGRRFFQLILTDISGLRSWRYWCGFDIYRGRLHFQSRFRFFDRFRFRYELRFENLLTDRIHCR